MDRESVLEYLKKRADRPLKPKEIARALDVDSHAYVEFKQLLRRLEDAGEIYRSRKGRYAVPERINLVVGRLQVTRGGHGFVVPEEPGDDVFVRKSNLANAYAGDRVAARIEQRRRGERNPEGTVVKVLERARSEVVGIYQRSGRYGFIIPEEPKLRSDVFVAPGTQAGVKDGELAVARIVDWGSDQHNPVGEVVKVLGRPGEPGVDVLAIVHGLELPVDFPAEALEEAEKLAGRGLTEEDLRGRTDFRELLTFTIDPADAKDHDDAVSIEPIDDGWRVGVHIADVSHFVRPGTELDAEALNRGTSVYLVDRVLPMLPEPISGHICSLRPDEDRLTLSVVLEMDRAARVRSTRVVEGVIRSHHRLSYEEAQAMIDGKRSGPADLIAALRGLRDLARELRKRRQARGGLDFDLPEAQVVLDAAGEPTHVHQIMRTESHQLIEEFMILTNESIASTARERDWPFIYRVHESPDPARLQELREFVGGLGLKLAKEAHRSPKPLQKLIESVEGRPEEMLVSTLILRSMKQAQYRAEHHGHFGLGSEAYTHFTSPIRRYPDLMIHRIVRARMVRDERLPDPVLEGLPQVAARASSRERQAMDAERDSVELKKIEYMERHVGDEFAGTVSGVSSYGLFVLLDDVLVEGLLHVSTLEDDYYHFVKEDYALVGESHGRRFRLGDRVDVRIIAVDRSSRELDVALAD